MQVRPIVGYVHPVSALVAIVNKFVIYVSQLATTILDVLIIPVLLILNHVHPVLTVVLANTSTSCPPDIFAMVLLLINQIF
jgi:hypothetical protein